MSNKSLLRQTVRAILFETLSGSDPKDSGYNLSMAKQKQFPFKGAKVKIIGPVGYNNTKHMGEEGTLVSVNNKVGTIYVMPNSIAKIKADNPADPYWSSFNGYAVSPKSIEPV